MIKKILTKRSSNYDVFNTVQAFGKCRCSCSSCSCMTKFGKNGSKKSTKKLSDLAGRM